MSADHMQIADSLSVAVGLPLGEMLPVRTRFEVHRWDEEQTQAARRRLDLPEDFPLRPVHFAAARIRPYLVTGEDDCNLVTLAGWAALLGSVGGTSITNKFSASFGRIGAGTGSTAPTAADTHLTGDTGGGSTTSFYQLISGAPTITTSSAPSTMVLSASFPGTVANFSWLEFGTDNYSVSGVTTQSLGTAVIFFNHGLSNQGSKSSGQTWSAVETFTAGFPSGAGTVS